MANFEAVVRPFQLPNNAPPQRYVAPKQASNPPVVLIFGRTGSGKSFSASWSSETTFYMDQTINEVTRK